MESTARENTALVREFLTTVVADSDTDAIGIFLSEEELDRHLVSANGVDSELVGATYWSVLAAADIDFTIDDIVATNEKVAVRGTVTGIQCGSKVAGQPTRHSFEIAVVWFCRIEHGLIRETWTLPSEPWLIDQLDAPLGGT